ncbi:MAG: hypothetical protein GWN62_07305 [Aliifodinibius sp.]|nr:hypothetical protein [candidate division KSB1 bacterium]NIV11094.1 hypothetical protein [Fodinibius sp.]NIS23542.1 hypothetical protein [candidate division KSB1 bacterium]NIU24169.1 hypothetical protein [candidate division KSB1 bacterium]NIW18023.1 hypothetical protein [candidate division KSB1 bacterium]
MRLLLNLLCLLCFFTITFAQSPFSQITQLKQYYESVEFEKTISTGKQLLNRDTQLTPEVIATIHRYLALSYYHTGKLDSSQAHFLSLLSIQPSTELDPVTTSPKIIEFFNEIKKDHAEFNESATSITYTKYLVEEDLRPGAAWRSALLPGWGQFYKNQSLRGKILGGAFWGSLIVTGISWFMEDQAHQDYLDSGSVEEINKNYDTYNQWFKTRRILTVSTIALWAITVGDAMWSPYPKPSIGSDKEGNVRIGLQWRLPD